MMLKTLDEGFAIYLGERLLVEHTKSKPAFYIGTKDLDISMKNGAFKIDDKTTYSPLNIVKMTENVIDFGELTLTLETDSQNLECWSFSGTDKPLQIHLHATRNERIHGMGEHFTSLDYRGHVVHNWVEEHITRKQIYSKILRRLFGLKPKRWPFEAYKTYFVMPTFVSSDLYFCDVDTDAYGTADFTAKDKHVLAWSKVPDKITFGYANDWLSLSSLLTRHKGIMPRLPEWIYDGMILAIQGGTEAVASSLEEMLSNHARINGVWSQDWCGELFTFFGKQVLWNWNVDQKLYPDLKAHILKWKEEGVHFLAYLNPYLNANEAMFKYAEDEGYLVKNEDGSPYLTKATSFDFGIVDLTNPEAYDWFKGMIKQNVLALGISGWMADFGEYLPTEGILHAGQGDTWHNPWPDLWIRLNREVLEETGMLGKAIFFNRAGYKDNLKYTTLIWNGDQHVDFTDDFGMGSAVRAMLSLSLSGVGISHSDVGGYTTVPGIKRSNELYSRWLAMNTFTPVMRTHEGNKPWVNAQFNSDPDLIRLSVMYSNIHAMLKPYLQTVENQYQTQGYPMIRPLFFHTDLYDEHCFMLGADLYVCPVIKARTKAMTIEIPSGGWVDLFSGIAYDAGRFEIATPQDTIPVFYRSDSKNLELFEAITRYIQSFREGKWH